MIVEITSLIPRVIFKIAAMLAHAAPETIATINIKNTCKGAGNET